MGAIYDKVIKEMDKLFTNEMNLEAKERFEYLRAFLLTYGNGGKIVLRIGDECIYKSNHAYSFSIILGDEVNREESSWEYKYCDKINKIITSNPVYTKFNRKGSIDIIYIEDIAKSIIPLLNESNIGKVYLWSKTKEEWIVSYPVPLNI